MIEREALLCLNAVSGLGSLRIQRLFEVFRTSERILKQGESVLRRVDGIGVKIAKNITRFDCESFLTEEMKLIREQSINIVTFFDDHYPQYLKQIPGFPIVLYCVGNLSKVKLPGIAIVGCRRASIYGQSVSRSLAKGLAYSGITVVSGMARGIDTVAHSGCLEADGTTVAVLGSGLGNVYPRENKKLFEGISSSGCVISEFPMMTSPQACNFPRRNRIISGLSAGVVVVEAAARSGALITARYALEQGREVFAVPGKVGQSQSVGTNRLIQQGAKLVAGIDDVLEEFPDLKCINVSSVFLKEDVQRKVDAVLHLLSDEPKYIDEIFEQCNMATHDIMRSLLQWECEGRVKRLPGNYFVKAP